MAFGLPKIDDVKRFFTAVVTEDSVDGVRVGKAGARMAKAISDEAILGTDVAHGEKGTQKPERISDEPLSEMTRIRLAQTKLAEAEYAEELERRQAGEA